VEAERFIPIRINHSLVVTLPVIPELSRIPSSRPTRPTWLYKTLSHCLKKRRKSRMNRMKILGGLVGISNPHGLKGTTNKKFVGTAN
jgi:hypothetical protein